LPGLYYGMIGYANCIPGDDLDIYQRLADHIWGEALLADVPSFIPITFEVTVLFAAIGMTATFYIICGLGPGVKEKTLDDRITDDKFCIAFDTNHVNGDQLKKLNGFFKSTGAAEVHTKTV
jgi:hypothetical protein